MLPLHAPCPWSPTPCERAGKLGGLLAWYAAVVVATARAECHAGSDADGAAAAARWWRVQLVAGAVLVNGVLCHATAWPYCVAWDVACNAVVLGWINVTTAWQPASLAATAALAAAHAGAQACPLPAVRAALHVGVVQGLAALLLVQTCCAA